MKRIIAFALVLFLLATSAAEATFSGYYLYYRRSGATYTLRLYTSTSDVGSHYIAVRRGGTTYYAKLDTATRADASYLRARVGGVTYAGIPNAHAYQSSWGSGFSHLEGLRYGANGIYLCDSSGSSVKQWTSDGSFVRTICSYGSGNGQVSGPGGCDSYSFVSSPYIYDRLYIADNGNYRVMVMNVYSGGASYDTSFGSYGSGNGQFYSPEDVALDSSHNVFVTDSISNRVQKFTSNGSYVSQFGSSGSGNGQFSSPQGIAIDSSGYIYVADYGNKRIQKFTSAGTYSSQWATETSYPTGITVGNDGYVYVSFGVSGAGISKYTTSGTLVCSGIGSSYLTTYSASGFEYLDGTLYVADSTANYVRTFQ